MIVDWQVEMQYQIPSHTGGVENDESATGHGYPERVEKGHVESQRQVQKRWPATTGAEYSKGTEDKSHHHDKVYDADVVTQRLQPVQNNVKGAQVQR